MRFIVSIVDRKVMWGSTVTERECGSVRKTRELSEENGNEPKPWHCESADFVVVIDTICVIAV